MKTVMNHSQGGWLLKMISRTDPVIKPSGPVEINKGNTIIKSTNGVTINDSFEVKNGASIEIRTN